MTWDGAQQRWVGSAPYLIVGPTMQHPDGNKESARVWQAPKAGVVHITAAQSRITVAAGPGADGVKLRILRNSSTVWPASGYEIAAPGVVVAFPGTDVAVNKGDRLYFEVAQNVGVAYDTVDWVPMIAYQ